MSVLKNLSFSPLPKSLRDPVSARRAKLIERLEEQKTLLRDSVHVRATQKWTTVDGQRKLVAKQQRVHPWWRTDASGALFMCIRAGSKVLEFEKGKAAIAVPSKDQLPKVIDTLIAAAKAGELDGVLAAGSKTVAKSRKAA